MNRCATTMGHGIYCNENDEWVYRDNGESIKTTKRECAKCDVKANDEGHDPCIANLPNVKHACCGHGIEGGYLMTQERLTLRFGKNDERLMCEIANNLTSVDQTVIRSLSSYTDSLDPNDRIVISIDEEGALNAGVSVFPKRIIKGNSIGDVLKCVLDEVDILKHSS